MKDIKNTISIFIACFLILFFVQHVLPHKSKNSLQQQEEIPKPAYVVEVIVTNVDVVVTDKKGNRITGLRPENFDIYEDRLLQKLTNFYEVKGMDVYAAVPVKGEEKLSMPEQPSSIKSYGLGNKIIMYFDNWHLHPLNRNWSINKLESFIRNNFSAEDHTNQGMVVCLGQKIEVVQDFTSNQGTLINAIKQVKKYTGQSLLQQRTKQDLRKELNTIVANTNRVDMLRDFERSFDLAKHYVESEQNDLMYSLKSLEAFMEYLTGIEGKKILIYVSDGLPLNPGEEVFSYLDQAFQSGDVRSYAMNYDATKLFKELTARCNAHEITLYPINAQGLESTLLSADQERGWNIYSQGTGMVRATSRIKNDALKLMARETGGLAVLNTNDIESGLKRIEDDLQIYYSLGYVSPHGEDNKYHSIKVELKGIEEKYDIRLRHGYVRTSQQEMIKEGVFSRLFLPRIYNPMKAQAQILASEPMPASKKIRLTIKILVPIKNLTLYQQNEEHTGTINVYIALMDADGRISPCHELTEVIKIPVKDFQVAMKSSYPYLAEMYVDPGSYIISLAVKDVPSGTINYLQLKTEVK